MRATEFITEVFQTVKSNWEWARLGTNEVSAFFKAGGRDYLWQAFTQSSNPKKWEIQFRLIRKPDTDPDELDLFGTTGTGNEIEVFSTAVDITRAFLQKYGLDNVEEITFNAKPDPKNDPDNKRASMYNRMITRLLPGWDLHKRYDSVDGMQFTLTDRRAYDKPENKIAEDTAPKVLYHVTPTSNVKSILAKGLVPSIGQRSSQLETEANLYFFPSKEAAEDAVMNWLGDELPEDEQLALLAVSSKGLEGKFTPGAEYEYTVSSPVPPQNIKVISTNF